MKFEKVIISGGGTGGHIFPALAIADEIKERFPVADILFVGAEGRMEMEKVPRAGYNIIGLPVIGMPRKPGKEIIKFIIRLFKSYNIAKRIIDQFKPQLAIGVGGFASAPLLKAAAAKGVPYIIQEQNSYAGITNKLLGKRAAVICVAFDKMEKYFPKDKIVITGNPVRGDLKITGDMVKEAAVYFGLKNCGKVILILGGSLGAQSVNEAVIEEIEKIGASDAEFIWQTGSLYYNRIMDKLKNRIPGNLFITEFISRMDLAYAAAGVVISRAGAGTISELSVAGKPAILVPSPNVAEDHQTKNARSLVRKEAAVMIADNKINGRLIDEGLRLINMPEKCSRLSENIKKMAKPEAAGLIVNEATKLLK